VQYLASAPSQLGLARAYVTGEPGDPRHCLRGHVGGSYPLDLQRVTISQKARHGKDFLPFALKRPAPPRRSAP
jgi:hypothetical protein